MWWYGTNTTSLESGTVIEHNYFKDQYYYVARLYYMDAPMFNYNHTSTNSIYTGTYWRYYFYYCDNGTQIVGNSMEGDKYGYGIYMVNCDASASSRGLVANNFVHVGNPSSTSTSYGIYMSNSGYFDIVHNSVNMESNGTNSRAFYGTSGGANSVYNNIFHNSGPGYAVYLASAYTVTDMDHNDLSSAGNVGYWSGVQATLGDWQSASGFDGNSVSTDPMFYSQDDLHVCNDTLDGAGAEWPLVTMDYDMQMRASVPDIGADEFTPTSAFTLGADIDLLFR